MSRKEVFGDSLLSAFYSIKRIDEDHTLSKDQWIASCQPMEAQLLKLYQYYKHKKEFYPLTGSFAESEYGVRQFSHGLIEGYKNHGAVEKVLEWNLRNLHEQRKEHGDNSATYAYYLMDLARAYQACGMKTEASSTLEIAIASLESKPPHRPLSRWQPTKSDIARDQQYEHRDIQNCLELLSSISTKELSQGGTLTYQKTSGQQVEMPYEDFDVAHSRYKLELAKISKLNNAKAVETCLRKLAELCYCHCRYKEAEDYYRQLLDIQTGISFAERTQRFTDRTELADLTELAGACRNQGEFSKAAALFEKVLQKKKKLDGNNYPNMALDLNNLAGLYYLQGDFKRAKPLNEQALALDQSRLGANHPAIAIYLKHLGQIHLELNEQQEAQKCFDRAHAIDRTKILPD
jgi:tetratricopeptide (TPR) repeat protein